MSGPDPQSPERSAASPPTETARLLARAQAGDHDALERLFALHRPALRRWASGRLPSWVRDLADTDDLVQEVLLQTCKRIELFDAGRETSLQAYLRQALLNRIRDEFRRKRRRPVRETLEPDLPDEGPSPFDEAASSELLAEYEVALDRLRPEDRELVVARIQMNLSYEEIGEVTGRPTANAARSAVVRALGRLAEEMRRGRT